MLERPYELVPGPDGMVARVRLRGASVLSSPLLNRGTAFTLAEREALGLTGLLPSVVSTMDQQLRRVYGQYQRTPGDLARNLYLAALRDRNEVLFYRLLCEHIEEMLPIVYTPTVGSAIERFSYDYGRPRGIYLSVDHPEQVAAAFGNYGVGPGDVDLIVATDSEGILGIGDWGIGGIQISIGKLALYIAAAGMHPRRVIPVVLDCGTDNPQLLDDDMYMGNRHPRVRGAAYDELIDSYVSTATRLFPGAMLHWEDFGPANARRILTRYAGTCATFNDDMQGTAAVVLAAAFGALRVSGARMRDQTVVIYGAGTAGTGIGDALRQAMISDGLSPAQARARFWAVDRDGLLTSDQAGTLRDFQVPYARPASEVAAWQRDGAGSIGLAEVVARVHPTMLIGTSAQAAAFTEPIVREMAAHTARPIILPLSNPTARAEAHPADLLRWTGGRALVATGSPFDPVSYGGRTYQIAQANNALIFPGLGLGVTVARARRVTDGMLTAAAAAVASMPGAGAGGAGTPSAGAGGAGTPSAEAGGAGTAGAGDSLLPPVTGLRAVSAAVAAAVAAAAHAEGVAGAPVTDPGRQVQAAMWEPEYPRLEPV